MAGLKCPFCGAVVPIIHDTHQTNRIQFIQSNRSYDLEWNWQLEMLRCPECEKVSTIAVGVGKQVKGKHVMIFPESSAIQFPEYVPEAIRTDYEEACSILCKSPKAAATLARRCLQGMIHDFWSIHGKNLNAEITQLKDHVPAAQWTAIDAVRSVGNIGAHMEQDVNLIIDISVEEAAKLLKLIEHLISKWYVDRHESEELYQDVASIGAVKQEDRGK